MISLQHRQTKINYSDVSYTLLTPTLYSNKRRQTSASTTSTSTAQPQRLMLVKRACNPHQFKIYPEIKQAITNLVAKVTSGDVLH